MVRAGISLPALQHLMGHSQIHTTMLYYAQTPDMCSVGIQATDRKAIRVV
jgi:site-specific recombinase XerD